MISVSYGALEYVWHVKRKIKKKKKGEKKMGEASMRHAMTGSLLCFGITILISHFCSLVPEWAKAGCDPLYLAAVKFFLAYCVVWFIFGEPNIEDIDDGFCNDSKIVQYAVGVAAILRWGCVSCLMSFLLKMLWNSGIWIPLFWVIAGLLLFCATLFQLFNFGERAGALAFGDLVPVSFLFTFTWLAIITYYSIA